MKAQARWMLQSEQASQAVALLQESMARMASDAEAHGLLGAALSRTGNDAAAVSHFEQAVRLEPQRPSNHFNLGVAYEKLGRLDWALEGYRQALLRDPAFEQAILAYYRLAQELAGRPAAGTPLPAEEPLSSGE